MTRTASSACGLAGGPVVPRKATISPALLISSRRPPPDFLYFRRTTTPPTPQRTEEALCSSGDAVKLAQAVASADWHHSKPALPQCLFPFIVAKGKQTKPATPSTGSILARWADLNGGNRETEIVSCSVPLCCLLCGDSSARPYSTRSPAAERPGCNIAGRCRVGTFAPVDARGPVDGAEHLRRRCNDGPSVLPPRALLSPTACPILRPPPRSWPK